MSDDPFTELISLIVRSLEGVGIPYAITGSVAGGVHGEPITSLDVDFVVGMTPDQARRLDQVLPPRFFRKADLLEETARRSGIVSMADADTGLKVDFVIPSSSGLNGEIFARRTLERYGPEGPAFYTVTAEDLILMKLLWRKDSRSQKQWDSALSVVRVQGASLDWKYLFEQSPILEIEDDLIKLRDEGGV